MKKLLLLITSLFLLSSCSKSDDDSIPARHQELINEVKGLYYLRAAYTDVPIDLNNDGIPQTNLFEEILYCNGSRTLDSHICIFSYRAPYYVEIIIEVPTTEYLEPEPISTCLRDAELAYDYEINFETEELSLVQSDWWDDFAAGFQTEFLDLRWEDGVAYFTLKKEFLNSSGEWQEVILYLEFEKFMDM